MSKTALIIVDYQNDFLPPDGALAVAEGRDIAPALRSLLDQSSWRWDLVVATQDYHPPKHISFASRHPPHAPFTDLQVTDGRGKTYVQTLWPDHAVQGTPGTEIEAALKQQLEPWREKVKICRKAWHPDIEGYSAFEGYVTEAINPADPPKEDKGELAARDTEMAQMLRDNDIDRVVVVGLATDFWQGSIKYTTLSAVEAGFETLVVGPAVRGVSKQQEDGVLDFLADKGAKVVRGHDWEDQVKQFSRQA